MKPSRRLQQFIETKLKGRVPLYIINDAIELVIDFDKQEQVEVGVLKTLSGYHEREAV